MPPLPMSPHRRARRWYGLLLLPFVFMLWPPLYDSITPMLWGVPFFYWYQFCWIVLSGVVIGIVYLLTREKGGT